MGTIYKHEMKENGKNLLIWFLCVGGMGFFCILLFSSMQESMEGMTENFASMGAFSDAFGMSQLSIATLTGFYATEVGTIHALGGAMFAAIISTNMLSKEEDGHTGEFLFSLPVSRTGAVTAKGCAVLTDILLFNIFCTVLYGAGIAVLGGEMPIDKFLLYHIMQFLMQMEIAAICYAVSSFMKRNRLGIGLGTVLLLYVLDLMARIIPDLSGYKAVIPFSYANAADILSGGKIDALALAIGAAVFVVSAGVAHFVYEKKDLAA